MELDRGEGIPWKGNYSSWLEQKAKRRLEQEEKTESKRRKDIRTRIGMDRMAPKARQSKGKARLNAYDKAWLVKRSKEKEAKVLELYIPSRTSTWVT